MPTVLSVERDTANSAYELSAWNDVIELDSAEPQTYTVPSGIDVVIINPVKQSDGSSTAIYYSVGANAIGSAITGSAFGNQPAGDGVEVVSSDNADTTQTITIYYTRDSLGDTVYSEALALTGTTQVVLTDTDAALVLGVELDAACAGTVTVREASGNATITTIAPAALSSGITTITDTAAGGSFVRMVGSDTTTKQIGLIGTDSAGAALLDSQALSSTTSVLSNSRFTTVTKVLHGDLESNRTVTLAALTAFVPSADDTSGASPAPINGPSVWKTAAGKTISFVRADSSATVNVCISGYTKHGTVKG